MRTKVSFPDPFWLWIGASTLCGLIALVVAVATLSGADAKYAGLFFLPALALAAIYLLRSRWQRHRVRQEPRRFQRPDGDHFQSP